MNKFIKYCLIGIVSLSALLTTNVFATDKPSEPYLFMKDMIQATGYIYSSTERLKIDETSSNKTDEVYVTTKMIQDLQTATYDIGHAEVRLNKHKDSKNETINESAEAMLVTLGLLSKNYQDTIKYFEGLYSKESIGNPDVGKMLSDEGKLMADRDEILKLCIQASIMSTYALVSDKEDKEGRASYLTITCEERDDLKKDLVDLFGEKIKEGLKVGQSLAMAPASALYEFLKRDFTPADKT